MNGDAAAFEAERGRLTGLAYRLLGSLSDAEDVLQDAWMRWRKARQDEIRQPSAYLSTVVTRLCLDRLKQARNHREIYIGPWLPEPLLEDPALTSLPAEAVSRDITFALMLALERLSPLERAAFILHDVFDMDYGDVAATLDRSEAACRQLARRARERVQLARPRFEVAPEQGEVLANAFLVSARSGDLTALSQLLADDATLHTDGGGIKPSALNIIHSAPKVARFFAGLARKPNAAPPVWIRRVRINTLPGVLTVEADGTRQAVALEIERGRINAVYVIRNPNKLTKLWASVPDAPAALG